MDYVKKHWWRALKYVLAFAVLAFVGLRFARDLEELDLSALEVQPALLVASAVLYVCGQALSGWYWYQLLRYCGQTPRLLPALRAYYTGQLGKYIPGKALALVIRASMVAPKVRFGVSIITAFYEVLTTMAAGALVSALLFAIHPPNAAGLRWSPVYLGLGLLVLVLIPLLPGVFNRLVGKLAGRFEAVRSLQIPHMRVMMLVQGFVATGIGWSLFGLSVWALMQAILPSHLPLTWQVWASYTAMISLAYVAGFLAVFVPSGVGVREFILLQLLPIEIAAFTTQPAEAVAAMAIILLRLVWTAAEVAVGGVLFIWPHASFTPRAD